MDVYLFVCLKDLTESLGGNFTSVLNFMLHVHVVN